MPDQGPMKLAASARELADRLAAAALLIDDPRVRKIYALEAIRLTTGDGTLTISANVLDHAVALTVPATIELAGEIAVPGKRLADLAAGFPRDATMTVSSDDSAARVVCGRSRFRLPAIPQDDLPPMLALGAETGRVELAREEALKVFERPFFAVATETTRYYLNGIFLHDLDGALVAVGTDAHRLCRVVVPGATGLSQDNRLIAPRSAVKIVVKLLADSSNERIVLRRSASLLAIEAAGFTFVSRLIDANFPDYRRVIPQPSANTATVARGELAQALGRIAAVMDPQVKAVARLVGLTWQAPEPELRLVIPGWPDLADDHIVGEVTGNGRTAMRIGYLSELLDELAGERVRLDANDAHSPMLVTDPADPEMLTVQTPCAWPFEHSQEAA
jgi:DNA polymerase III subunit beta